MELVGAGLGGDVDDVACGEAVLRGEGVGLDLELVDAVDGGDVDDGAPVGGGVPNAVEEEGGGAKEAAAEVEEGDVLVGGVLGAAARDFLAGGGVLDGGVESGEAVDVAEVEGELDDLLRGDVGGEVGVVEVEQGDLAGDGDFVGAGADAEGDALGGGLAGGEDDALLDEGLEAGGVDLEGVGRGREQLEGVAAAGSGREGAGDAVFGSGEGDGGARDDSAGRVGDGAVKGRGGGLILSHGQPTCEWNCSDGGDVQEQSRACDIQHGLRPPMRPMFVAPNVQSGRRRRERSEPIKRFAARHCQRKLR